MRVKPSDLPEAEHAALEPFFSDNDSGSDVETILAVNEEAARKYAPEIPPDFNQDDVFLNTILIINVPSKKLEKVKESLHNVIKQRLTEEFLLPPGSKFHIELPKKEDTGTGLKFAIVTFEDKLDMDSIIEVLGNSGLDRKYTFKPISMKNYELCMNKKYTSRVPLMEPFAREHSRDWLTDEMGREQYAYRCGATNDVMWFDAFAASVQPVCEDHEQFGRAFCWSPLGTYLLTIHKQGVWIRGNDNFEKLMSFNHANVRHVLFSPDETLLITYNGSVDPATAKSPPIIVWNCLTGEKLKTLPVPPLSPNNKLPEDVNSWPLYLFSPDSKYLAASGQSGLMIYDTTTMNLIDECDPSISSQNKPAWTTLKMELFQWSPVQNLLSVWIAESKDTPGRLLIVNMNTRQEIASKNVFSVTNVSMHWIESGDYLAVVTVLSRRLHKKNKKDITQIEVFRVNEKSVPVDIIDLESLIVKSLYWENGYNASRFATLTLNEQASTHSLNFFEIPAKGSKLDPRLVQSQTISSSINFMKWSPTGQYFVAAARNGDGQIVFGAINDQNKLDILATDEQLDLTDIMWDPSGRYVATASLLTAGTPEFRMNATAGFRIFTFLGRLLYHLELSGMSQFLWRPRPTLLPIRAEMEEISKNLKDYSKRFDAQDELRKQARMQAIKEEGFGRLAKLTEWWNIADDFLKSHADYAAWESAWQELNSKLEWQEESSQIQKVLDVKRIAYK